MITFIMTALEKQFEDACLSDVSESKQLGYNPSYFLKMLDEYGAVETARRLILQQPLPEGFSRLWEMHRLDLTIEACVHDNPQFHSLFDAQTLTACDARLASVGYI
jgi:hypothetical protein